MAFSKGVPKGYQTSYYPNGLIYATLKLSPDLPYYSSYYFGALQNTLSFNYNNLDIHLIECRDSTAQLLAVNGTGHVIVYNNDFTKTTQEGNIVKDKRDGD